MLIRPLQATDFTALATYRNALAPEQTPVTAQVLQAREAAATNERITGLVIALDAATIVATGRYSEAQSSEAQSSEDRPGTFWLYFDGLPTHRTATVWDALFHGMVTALTPHHPTALQGMAREDDATTVAFFQRQGFAEKLRSFGANLDLTTFDPAAHAPDESHLPALGIAIKSYAELVADPHRDRKLYDFHQEVMSTIPNMGQFDAQSFAEFVANHLHNPKLLPDAYFIATRGDEYIGLSELFAGDELGVFDTQSTGVKPAYRRLGLALALKMRALAYAKAHGGVRVTTGMAATNTPIVSLNQRLGFVPEPMWITFHKALG